MAAGRAGPSNPRQPSPSECPPASEGFGSPLPVPQAQVSGAEGRAGAGGSAGQASVPECRRSQLLLGRRKEAPAYLRHGSREGPSTGKRGAARPAGEDAVLRRGPPAQCRGAGFPAPRPPARCPRHAGAGHLPAAAGAPGSRACPAAPAPPALTGSREGASSAILARCAKCSELRTALPPPAT